MAEWSNALSTVGFFFFIYSTNFFFKLARFFAIVSCKFSELRPFFNDAYSNTNRYTHRSLKIKTAQLMDQEKNPQVQAYIIKNAQVLDKPNKTHTGSD